MTTPNLNDQLALLRNFDPHRLANEVIAVGEEWADLDAAAAVLEETRKTVLAKRVIEFVEAAGASGKRGMSVAQAEMQALADPTYEAHLETMVSARKNANRARVRYDLGRLRLELLRTAQATLRNEMRLSSHQP